LFRAEECSRLRETIPAFWQSKLRIQPEMA
jgi:hypothetical protein